jgi:hypothetical protein
MKKSIHPRVVMAILAVCVLVIIIVYYKKTEPPPPVPMSPRGPGAMLLKAKGLPHGATPDVLEAQKKTQQSPGGAAGQ